jgi:hypothetical protein
VSEISNTVSPAAAPTVSARPAAAAPLQPPWVIVLDWERRRGRQVILHGEVGDRYWLNGQPASLRTVLCGYFVDAQQYDIVGWWNPLEGLTFPRPAHERRFVELRTALDTAHGAGPIPSDGARPPQGHEPAPGSRGGRLLAANRDALAAPEQAAAPSELEQVLDLVRRITASAQASSLFVFEDVDAELPAGDPASVRAYLRLRAAMDEAAVPERPRGRTPYARNGILLTVGDLSRLPAWLHEEDPRVVTLQLNRPDQAERRLWLGLLREQFHGLPPDADLEPLVAATDGLSAWEIDALARTSVIRAVPADRPDRLMAAHRYNVRVNPWERLDAAIVADGARRLSSEVIGQDHAVDAVAEALKAAFVGVDFGSGGAARPRGVFFFVGPTGVGKTQLAKSVAKLLFGDEEACIRFDMSEYREEHAAERLAGAPPGYVGHERGGELTRRVRERPFSVLLFDEIEKAAPSVLDKFLQILEDGRMTDGRGMTTHFSQTLIIFTSNIGAGEMWDLAPGNPDGPDYEQLRRHFTERVEEKFRAMSRPEIFGRLKPGIVVFDMLRTAHVAGIADGMVDQLVESAREQRGLVVRVDRAAVRAWMVECMRDPEVAKYGGREIRNRLDRLRAGLVAYVVAESPAAGSEVSLTIRPDGTVVAGPVAQEAAP